MSIPCKAVLSNLTIGTTPVYRVIPKDVKHLSEADFLALVAEKAGQDVVQARFWLDSFRDVLFTSLMNNIAVDTGFMYAKLAVGGSLTSASQQPNKVANPVRANIHAKGALADTIAAVECVNDTVTVEAVLYEIMQDGASAANRIESTTARVVINGNRIKLDSTQTDNGVYLADAVTGAKLKDATVSYSDQGVIYATFPQLPTNGRYKLVVATRNAESEEAYAISLVSRLVDVAVAA